MSVVFALCVALAQVPPADVATVDELAWPREVTAVGVALTAFQPQVDSWDQFTSLRARMAIEVLRTGEESAHYAVVHFRAETRPDFATRAVVLTLDVERVAMAESTLLERLVEQLFDGMTLRMSLDRLLASIDPGERRQGQAAVNLEAPPVFYSEVPALLLQFAGRPWFERVPGTTLRYAVNTNWDVLVSDETARYYLRHGDAWLTAEDLEARLWQVASQLPADMRRLPDALGWEECRANVPGRLSGDPWEVFYTERAAELFVTDGSPRSTSIPDTPLTYVTNTDSDLFYHRVKREYYLAAAGRWLRAKARKGPWEAATHDLPPEFASIPAEHPKAHVLASVPGTPESLEAVIRASIPRRATLARSAEARVAWDGEPRFEPIEETGVAAAVNTRSDVFRVEGSTSYYLCFKGAWFSARQPTGRWKICESVPAALYTIPPRHPRHHVTYVRVYESGLREVVVGYTAGYKGMFVRRGVVVFGAGWPVVPGAADEAALRAASFWPSFYAGYGSGVRYSATDAAFYRIDPAYGPYGGGGRNAVYDPGTEEWIRGTAAYGPTGSRLSAEGYQPWGGTYGLALLGSHGYESYGRAVRGSAESDVPPEFQVVLTPAERANDVFVMQDALYQVTVAQASRWENGEWVALPLPDPNDDSDESRERLAIYKRLAQLALARQKSDLAHQVGQAAGASRLVQATEEEDPAAYAGPPLWH